MSVSNTSGLPVSLPAEMQSGFGGQGSLEALMDNLRSNLSGRNMQPTASAIEQQTVQGFGQSMASGQQFGSSQFEGSQLGSSQFEGSQFEGSQFEGSQFEGSQFEGSQFEGSQFEGSQFGRSQFESSQLGSSQFEGSQFGSSQFESSQFGSSQFGSSQFEGGQFGSGSSTGGAASMHAFNGQDFLEQNRQLADSGQSFSNESTSSFQDANGRGQTSTQSFLNEEPLSQGYEVRGGSFTEQSQQTPIGTDTRFSGETFTRQFPTATQQTSQPQTQPAAQLTASGNTISDGRYQITANQFGTNTVGVTDEQTHTTLVGFGDTHWEDGAGDSGNIQSSTADLSLPDGTQLMINNTPLSATGVSTLATVQVMAGGTIDQLSGFGGTSTATQNVAPMAAQGPILQLSTNSDLNHIQVQTANGPQAALAPDLGNTKLDQFAQQPTNVPV